MYFFSASNEIKGGWCYSLCDTDKGYMGTTMYIQIDVTPLLQRFEGLEVVVIKTCF